MPASGPYVDMATLLAAQGQGALGVDIFASPVRGLAPGIPASALYVMPELGEDSELNTGSTIGTRFTRSRVRVTALWMTDDFDGAVTKILAARAAVQYQKPSGYVDIRPEGSGFTYAGKNRAAAHELYFMCQMWHEET